MSVAEINNNNIERKRRLRFAAHKLNGHSVRQRINPTDRGRFLLAPQAQSDRAPPRFGPLQLLKDTFQHRRREHSPKDVHVREPVDIVLAQVSAQQHARERDSQIARVGAGKAGMRYLLFDERNRSAAGLAGGKQPLLLPIRHRHTLLYDFKNSLPPFNRSADANTIFSVE
jgi:hypothetical protein